MKTIRRPFFAAIDTFLSSSYLPCACVAYSAISRLFPLLRGNIFCPFVSPIPTRGFSMEKKIPTHSHTPVYVLRRRLSGE